MGRNKGAPRIRVVNPGEYLFDVSDRHVATGVELEHPGPDFEGWHFVLDVAPDGDVVALTMRPARDPDSPPFDRPYWPDGGISSTKHLRRFPLDALVRAARAHVAEDLAADAAKGGPVKVSDAIPFRKRPGKRRGPYRHKDAALAAFMRDYIEWVEAGGRVDDFARHNNISTTGLDNRRRRAKQLELYVGSGKHGRAGGTLTEKAKEILRLDEQEGA
jgi:hypothetical protein